MQFSTGARMLAGASAVLCLAQAAPVSAQSDAQIRERIIRQSIAAYSGSCPCPYSIMRNGRQCGGRSAYSRPGGEAPICYARDVTAADIAAHRR